MPLFFTFILCFSFALFYAWILYLLDRYEKEPRLLLGGVFIWGALVAAGAAFILNTIFGIGLFALSGNEIVTDIVGGVLVAPLTEETFKAFAVLIVFFIFRKEFDSILDGIVYAGIAALGFAATENVLYLYERGFMEEGWQGLWFMFFLRIILGAWNHPFYTAFTGIGLAVSRLNRNMLVKIAAPFLGWFAAMAVHALHNLLASFARGMGGLIGVITVDWLGWLFMLAVIVFATNQERNWIKVQLKDEVEAGTLTSAQYAVSSSSLQRNKALVNALFNGRYRDTNKFYHLCTELAYTKHQRTRTGEASSNSAAMIDEMREQIQALSPQVKA